MIILTRSVGLLLCIHPMGPFDLCCVFDKKKSFSVAMLLSVVGRVFPNFELEHPTALLLHKDEVPLDASLVLPGEEVQRPVLPADAHVVPAV